MSKKTGVVYEFGSFRIDTVERQLTCDGQTVPLQPKVFDTLLVLVENSGHILEKADLLSELWPDTFVEESSLTQNIFHLRKALGESGSKHQFIETIPRRGYRFLAEVKKISEQSEVAATNGSSVNGSSANGSSNGSRIPAGGVSLDSSASRGSRQRESLGTIAGDPFFERVSADIEPAVKETNRLSKNLWLIVSASILATAVLAIGIYLIISYQRTHTATPFERMRISMLTASGNAIEAAISPDGKYVAYVLEKGAEQSLWVRQTVTTSNMQIAEPVRVVYRGVTFSPDSNFIYYVAYQAGGSIGILYRTPVLGGLPAEVINDIDSPVTFSPDGQRLAFTRFYPKERESSIVVADSDGKNEIRIATRREPDFFPMTGPAWSPDGKIIASPCRKTDERGSYTLIVAIKPDGKGEEPLTPQKWNYIGRIAWGEDGQSLAAIGWHRESCVLADQIWSISYPEGEARRVTNDTNGYRGISLAANGSMVTIRSQRSSQIYTATDLTLRNAKQITSGFGDHFSQRLGMTWAPDGRIFYSSNATGNPDIWVMEADGANLKQLTFDARGDFLPQITSDGRYMVFVSERNGMTNIWRADIDGSNPKQLTEGKGEFTPSLSPDGRWVVYFTNENGLPGLWKVSIDGGSPVRLSSTYCAAPSVSPDGKFIACLFLDTETGNSKPAVIDFESGNIIRIFDTTPFPAPPLLHWSADSRSFIYMATANGASNVWLQPVDGSAARMLSDFKAERLYRLALSSDGKRIAFERGNDITDVVLITNFD